jgi:hypothetical protein
MKRVVRHVAAVVMVAGCAGALASACAHNDSSIFIYNVIDPGTTTPGGTCTFTPNPSQTIIESGALDDSLALSFQAVFLVGNQLVAQGDPTVPRTETSYFNVQGATVRITAADGTPVTSYTNLQGSSIPPASGGTPGYGLVGIEIVNEATVAKFKNSGVTLITYTTIFGRTLGGQYIESNEFEFPVTLCTGCLIEYQTNPNCSPQPNCVGTGSTTGSTTTTVPCFVGQGPTNCTTCSGELCNPVVNCGTDAGLTD